MVKPVAVNYRDVGSNPTLSAMLRWWNFGIHAGLRNQCSKEIESSNLSLSTITLWMNGKSSVCKTEDTGSIPVRVSMHLWRNRQRSGLLIRGLRVRFLPGVPMLVCQIDIMGLSVE